MQAQKVTSSLIEEGKKQEETFLFFLKLCLKVTGAGQTGGRGSLRAGEPMSPMGESRKIVQKW